MDIRTMIVILAVLTACSALVIIFIHKLHFSVQGTLYWACGLVTIACSLILFALEGILPDFITIVFADTAIVYGFSIVLSGMRIFVGRTSRLKVTLALPLIIPPLSFWYSQVDPSLATRIILVYLMLGALSGAVAYELLSETKSNRQAQRFTGYIFAANTASFLIHIILTLVHPPSVTYLQSGPVTIGLYLWSLIYVFLFTAGIIMMISEKLQAEQNRGKESLQESEEKLVQAIQGTSIPTFIIDSNHIITHWNNACENLTGFSEAEMVNTRKHWGALNPLEDQLLADFIVDGKTEQEIERYYKIEIYKSILIKGALEGEKFYPNLGEKGKWLFFTAAPLKDQDGNIIGAIETIQDITERRKTEEQLRQAQKMESVGRLAGGVAHDYNNALTAIMGFTELTMMDEDPTGPLHTNLNEVLKAAIRAQDITRQLLAFARKQTITPMVLDLNKNVETMLKMLQRLIGEDIDLAWLPGTDLEYVKMDPSQIDQILANLCVNARDAIKDVGKVTIETGTRVFDAAYCADHVGFIPGKFVVLSVSDNGCGMDKEILNNIFEPFFTTKDIDKGTGLGLSTVYGIVKQNNGFINVYSEPGKGTTVKIYLPRHEGKAVDIQIESTTEIPLGRGEVILLVEDDLSILKLTEKILVGIDYTVLTADTPDKALRLADEYTGEIHLLVTDVIMPEMNGRELSERLRSLYPDLKCIFMSGYTSNAIAHHGVLDKRVHFIQKPFFKKDLGKIVRKALDK